MSGATTMKPRKDSTKKKAPIKVPKETSLPDDRVILDTLYKHYGTPENIAKEKVKLYTSYRSPAGWSQDDWIEDGFQMGRVTVFVTEEVNANDIVHRTRICGEGKGTWFIGVSDKQIKVWISGKLDKTLDIEV